MSLVIDFAGVVRRAALPLGLGVGLLLIAPSCIEGDDSTVDEQTEQNEQEIVGGSVDQTHNAVVYIQGSAGACTATIVAVSGNNGYALTAAHCAGNGPPTELWRGYDLNNPIQIHNIVEYAIHPNYDTNSLSYDFMMLRFTGANGSVPVMPAMTPANDNLQIGTPITHSGYGLMNSGGNLVNSDLRRMATGTVANLPTAKIEYNQSWSGPGGPCSGDSGGPAISNGLVAGVTSYGDGSCNNFGVSGRVSSVYNSFINPFITGQPGTQSCDECFGAATNPGGACSGTVDACFNNTTCANLAECVFDCTTQACVNGCANSYSGGITLYNAIFDCGLCTACGTECASECANLSTSGPGATNGTPSSAQGTTVTTGGDTVGVGTGDMSTVAGTGGGDAGSGGSGGKKKKSGSAADSDDDSGCSVVNVGDNGQAWIGLLGLMAGLAGLSRRRRQ